MVYSGSEKLYNEIELNYDPQLHTGKWVKLTNTILKEKNPGNKEFLLYDFLFMDFKIRKANLWC